MRITMFY